MRKLIWICDIVYTKLRIVYTFINDMWMCSRVQV